jgi:hypothetical protein
MFLVFTASVNAQQHEAWMKGLLSREMIIVNGPWPQKMLQSNSELRESRDDRSGLA